VIYDTIFSKRFDECQFVGTECKSERCNLCSIAPLLRSQNIEINLQTDKEIESATTIEINKCFSAEWADCCR